MKHANAGSYILAATGVAAVAGLSWATEKALDGTFDTIKAKRAAKKAMLPGAGSSPQNPLPLPASDAAAKRIPKVAGRIIGMWSEVMGEPGPIPDAALEILLAQAWLESGVAEVGGGSWWTGKMAGSGNLGERSRPKAEGAYFDTVDLGGADLRYYKAGKTPDGTERDAADAAIWDFLHDRLPAKDFLLAGDAIGYAATQVPEARRDEYTRALVSHLPAVAAALGHNYVSASIDGTKAVAAAVATGALAAGALYAAKARASGSLSKVGGTWDTYPDGANLPGDIIDAIGATRSAIPPEPKLVKSGKGHFYMGDPAHKEYLSRYLDDKASAAHSETRRGILAFNALQGREGSTAAINTYDNQILTWGTGWSGLGALPLVMTSLSADPLVKGRLFANGIVYNGNGNWSVVDTNSGKIVKGKAPALEVMRKDPRVLYLLIDLARSPDTRDAVTDAQLGAFLTTSGKIVNSEAIQSQALYNFIAHLQHWAPGYASGVLSGLSGDDCALAAEAAKRFYAKASKTKWIPSWDQFKGYVRDMAKDGLDCTGSPIFQASSPPTGGSLSGVEEQDAVDIGGTGAKVAIAAGVAAAGAGIAYAVAKASQAADAARTAANEARLMALRAKEKPPAPPPAPRPPPPKAPDPGKIAADAISSIIKMAMSDGAAPPRPTYNAPGIQSVPHTRESAEDKALFDEMMSAGNVTGKSIFGEADTSTIVDGTAGTVAVVAASAGTLAAAAYVAKKAVDAIEKTPGAIADALNPFATTDAPKNPSEDHGPHGEPVKGRNLPVHPGVEVTPTDPNAPPASEKSIFEKAYDMSPLAALRKAIGGTDRLQALYVAGALPRARMKPDGEFVWYIEMPSAVPMDGCCGSAEPGVVGPPDKVPLTTRDGGIRYVTPEEAIAAGAVRHADGSWNITTADPIGGTAIGAIQDDIFTGISNAGRAVATVFVGPDAAEKIQKGTHAFKRMVDVKTGHEIQHDPLIDPPKEPAAPKVPPDIKIDPCRAERRRALDAEGTTKAWVDKHPILAKITKPDLRSVGRRMKSFSGLGSVVPVDVVAADDCEVVTLGASDEPQASGLLIAAIRQGRQAPSQWGTIMLDDDIMVEVMGDAMKADVDGQLLRLPVSYNETIEAAHLLGHGTLIPMSKRIADAVYRQSSKLVYNGLVRTAAESARMRSLDYVRRFNADIDAQIVAKNAEGLLQFGAWKLWILSSKLGVQARDGGGPAAINYGGWNDKGKPIQTEGTWHIYAHDDYSQLLQFVRRWATRKSTGGRVDLLAWIEQQENVPRAATEPFYG